ncbi:DUF4157 domain-containing protein [Micromonospora rubida]|uniref:DUF4157 domain-containing protein n=1 Tax=Micromonospora rubida TaxID=2697657 RepID=A0ABW7SJ65_9ACTN
MSVRSRMGAPAEKADGTSRRAALESVLASPGRPLAADIRQDMERRFGISFADVRIHDDATAHRAAMSVDAQAFTTGSHIVFAGGPAGSAANRRTLIHELTHVVQQRQGPVAGTPTGDGLRLSDPSDAHERTAASVSEGGMGSTRSAVVASQPVPAAPPSPATVIQRVVTRRVAPPGQPGQIWHSDVTGGYYASREEAERDEAAAVAERAEDPDYSPRAGFLESAASRARRERPLTALEQLAADWQGGYREFETGAGPVSVSRGWGRQPYIRSRLAHYDGARVSTAYTDFSSVLDAGRSDQGRERLARRIRRASLGGRVDFSGYDFRTRRAAAHLIAITQVAEDRRTPGSGVLARAALRLVADGILTFGEAFARQGGLYVPAHQGGTREMRETAGGDVERLDETLAGQVPEEEQQQSEEEEESDESDEEFAGEQELQGLREEQQEYEEQEARRRRRSHSRSRSRSRSRSPRRRPSDR